MGSGKHSILFVDDEVLDFIGLTRALSRRGYSINPFTNFDEAYDQINKRGLEYDVALIDIAIEKKILHEGSVLSACRVRHGEDIIHLSRVKYPEAKIIATSGDRNVTHFADAFLLKPFYIGQLISTIDNLFWHN